MNPIRVKAGKKAYALIKDRGFHFDLVTTYYAPAAGPRWLVASGFDLALLQNGVLGQSQPVSLIGASAGAWRFAAWVQPEPEKSYRTLMEKYITTTYTRNDNSATVLKSLRAIIDAYLAAVDVRGAIRGLASEGAPGLRGDYIRGLAACFEVMWDLVMELLGKGAPVPYERAVLASTGEAPHPSLPKARRSSSRQSRRRSGRRTPFLRSLRASCSRRPASR